jgi:hypothetical protein
MYLAGGTTVNPGLSVLEESPRGTLSVFGPVRPSIGLWLPGFYSKAPSTFRGVSLTFAFFSDTGISSVKITESITKRTERIGTNVPMAGPGAAD